MKELEVLAIDCQATHSNPDKGHILEIGWIKTRASTAVDVEKISKDVETFLLKIPRSAEIPRAVLRITGIPQEELKSAHSPREVWQHLSQTAEQIAINSEPQKLNVDYGTTCPAVIHFCRYEESYLRKLHKKYGPKKNYPFSTICTHEIAKRLLPGLPRKSLRAVAGYFGLSLPESRRCLHHVAATALIWYHFVKLLEDTQNIHTYDELQGWLRKSTAYISNHKGLCEYPMAETYRKDLPNLSGIYRMYRSSGDLLYIGKAKALRQRISSYFHKGSRHPEHILEMLSQAQSLDTTITRTAFEAALLESDEIKRHAPPYNRALRTNERDVLFFSRDLKSSNPQPDSCHSIGPLSSSYNLNPLILLGNVLNGDLRKTSLKVIEGILDIPSEYLPGQDCFISGVKAFKQEFQTSLKVVFDLTTLISLGAQFWKDKLEEQAAEEAENRESAEAAVAKKEAPERSVEKAALGDGTASEPEEEKILELKMQESEDKEIVDTWTPERIVKVLKSIIRLGAFQIRRSRWFCRLSESSLVWTPVVGDAEVRSLIVFKGGTPLFKDPLSSSETVPLPPGHKKSLVERQKNFDLLVYDRMRVATTEIRRLIQEERTVDLYLHPDVCLRNEQLKRMLQWV